ncbi:unnamed protein product [Closterium sp. NIES-65]|nr:unnamed protein product [Closterium sp. NIES-65]
MAHSSCVGSLLMDLSATNATTAAAGTFGATRICRGGSASCAERATAAFSRSSNLRSNIHLSSLALPRSTVRSRRPAAAKSVPRAEWITDDSNSKEETTTSSSSSTSSSQQSPSGRPFVIPSLPASDPTAFSIVREPRSIDGAVPRCAEVRHSMSLPESTAHPSLFDVPGPSPSVGARNSEAVREELERLIRATSAAESARIQEQQQEQEQRQGWNPFSGVVKKVEDAIPAHVRGLVLLNVLTFLYGSNITVVKEAASVLDPFTFSATRFAIAAAAFAPFLASALRTPHVRRAGLELGVWASLAYVTQAVGLLTTDAGRASFIGTFTVIEVPILAGLFGAKIPPVTWVAGLAAICGVGLLESSGADSSFMGDLWTIVSALVFGVHILRSEHHAKHVTTAEALPLISLQLAVTAVLSTLWVSVGSSSGLLAGCGWESLIAGDWRELAAWPWVEMVYTGVLSTALCLWIEVVALKDVSAPEAAMVYTLEPLWGAAFAWVLLGERWGPAGWVGAGLILGGSVSMQMFGQVEEEHEHHATTPAIAATSPAAKPLLAPADKTYPSPASPALSALGVAAAVALVMTATTTGLPVADMGSSTNSVLTWVRGLGRWGGSEMEMVMEGEREVEMTTAAAVAALGGEELASLASLIKVYALVRQDEEAAEEEEGEMETVAI